uniref:Gag-Pol polyprotein n=1 Tax=Tanacetum cinerariifolium TaxID=118510 RepID=A0A6L2L9S7_TANCI|nr:Gag-Pol polyprotein [Tanacetum cinerariifolium]
MRAILTKDKCLVAIGERPAEVTDDKWDEMDENAVANLHLALADGVLSSIEEKKTAKDIWDHLARLYEARSLHNKIFLKRKLYALRMKESTSVTEHLIITLTGNILTDSLVFNDVAVFVLERENRRNNREDRQVSLRQVEALVVTKGRSMEPGSSGSHNHGKSKTRKKKVKYYKCGKQGHFRKDCRGLNTLYPQGNVASTSNDGNALCCEATVVNEGKKIFADVWLFDTGATFHVTTRREWFHQYKSISRGRSIYSCNDHELKIIEIRSIMGKMHDGTVRTIQDVRHTKGLKKNLLSLGQLDDLGYKVEIQNKIMKIIKEQGMKILVKKKLIQGLTKETLGVPNQEEVQKGIKRQFTTAYTPQQNGVAGHMNKTLLERARAMLATTSLGKPFWAEAVNTACYVINRSPSTAVELKTPMEMWTGKPVYYSDLNIFRSLVYVMYNSQETTKLDLKSRKCLFLGYADGVKRYRLWDPTSNKVIVSRDVVFMEDNIQENEEGWHSDYVMESKVAYCLLIEEGEPSTLQEVERYRARLVVKGYAQKERIDFNEIFSPVVPMTTVRVVLALCAMNGFNLEQLDVKTAPRCWYKRFDSFIKGLGYNRLHTDPCAYFKREFEMKDLGLVNKILGMQIHRDRVSKEIWLSQKSYVKKILQRFNMQDCKLISTPFLTNVKLSSKMSPSSKKRGWRCLDKMGSKLQSVVAMSITKAEYVAAAQASKEAVWLKMLLEELGHEHEKITLF